MNTNPNSFGKESPIHTDAEILSGTPVFVGTRVPAQTLFDYLSDGCTLEEFLDNFPSVTRAQAMQLLELASTTVLAKAA
jgi:uncharacterized protein (DUF433 family)